MGTNYYCRRIPTADEKFQMETALIEGDYEKLEKQLRDFRKTWHIGKYSHGWQFLWCPHIDKYGIIQSPWEDNLKSIKEFLSRDDIEIFDESGQFYSVTDFFDEIKDSLYSGWDLRQYWIDNPGIDDIYMSDWTYHEYKSDNLRFDRTADFC